MSEGRIDHYRTRWTNQRCIDLINSRNEAKLSQDSDDCPVKENGRSIGIKAFSKPVSGFCWLGGQLGSGLFSSAARYF